MVPPTIRVLVGVVFGIAAVVIPETGWLDQNTARVIAILCVVALILLIGPPLLAALRQRLRPTQRIVMPLKDVHPAAIKYRDDPEFRAVSVDVRRQLIRHSDRLLDNMTGASIGGLFSMYAVPRFLHVAAVTRWDSLIDYWAHRFGWDVSKSTLYKVPVDGKAWRRNLATYVTQRVEALRASLDADRVSAKVSGDA